VAVAATAVDARVLAARAAVAMAKGGAVAAAHRRRVSRQSAGIGFQEQA